jgi:hypothetical protein
MIKDSEADRAARLEQIHTLTALLNESETDRAARLEQIHAPTALLNESELYARYTASKHNIILITASLAVSRPGDNAARANDCRQDEQHLRSSKHDPGAAALARAVAQRRLVGDLARARHCRCCLPAVRQRLETGRKPDAAEIWWRFPKFVIGFLVASLIVTLVTAGYSLADYNKTVVPSLVGPIKDLRSWAFIFCFLSIGLTTRFRDLATAGTKPFLAFSAGAVVNIVVGFVLSALVFAAHWENLAR